MVPDRYLKDFGSLFMEAAFKQLSPCHTWDHAIKLKLEVKSISSKIYPLSKSEQAELDKFLTEHLATGWIWPSKLPFASLFFFIKKKDGSLCPVQDYCCLNEFTIKNQYPLPLISELIDKLKLNTLLNLTSIGATTTFT